MVLDWAPAGFLIRMRFTQGDRTFPAIPLFCKNYYYSSGPTTIISYDHAIKKWGKRNEV
jgi:hypothetical protein